MPVDVISALELLEGSARGNARKDTLRLVDSPELREVLYLALSPDITFGQKQLPAKPKLPWHHSFGSAQQWLFELRHLTDELKEQEDGSRLLTGNAAKTRIGDFFASCDDVQLKWTERIIKQDLRLSIGAKDVNAILGKDTIPLFAIPLAEPFKHLKSLTHLWYVQPKMDGGRVVARMSANGGPVVLLSRSGKEWPGFHDIKADLAEYNRRVNSPVDYTLDGELVVYKNGRMDFNAMQRLFHVKDNRKPDGDLKYVLFDHATTEEYDNPSMTYGQRFASLHKLVDQHPLPCSIEVIEYELVDSPTVEYLNTVANKFVLELGCDGAIIRLANKVPVNKKTSDITKIKPFEDGEAVIIDKIEGNGWLEGSLGKLRCRFVDKKLRPVGPEFDIGTGEGLTKELRQELWDDPELIGKIVNFKYLRLSDDGIPIHTTYRSIRHPSDIGR